MFINTLKKIAGLGMALCIAGTLVLSTPATVLAEEASTAPLYIYNEDDNGED